MCIVLFDIAIIINNHIAVCAATLPTVAKDLKLQRCSQRVHPNGATEATQREWLVLTYPSEKYEFVSWDDDISDIWKKRNHVPNHQPEIVHRIRPRCIFLYKLLDVRWFILITHSGCNPSVCLAMKSPSFFLQSRENPRTGPGFTLNLLQGSKYEQPYGCMMANLQPEDSTWKKNAGSPFKELHQKSLQG